MKRSLKLAAFAAALSAAVTVLTSCGTPFPLGCLYTSVELPVAVGDGKMQYNRVGEAKCSDFLGWFAGGDASLNAAAHNGQLTRISWANQKVVNYFGIYGTYTTVAYGFGDTPDPSVAPKATTEE